MEFDASANPSEATEDTGFDPGFHERHRNAVRSSAKITYTLFRSVEAGFLINGTKTKTRCYAQSLAERGWNAFRKSEGRG